MYKIVLVCILLIGGNVYAQTPADTPKPPVKVLIVPNQTMMHFSDSDEEIARQSHKDVNQVRNQLRLDLEANIYHQLLTNFAPISLLRATTLNGEEDLNRIYAATKYQVYSKQAQEEYIAAKGNAVSQSFKNISEKFKRKSKDQTFWASDSSVMLGAIGGKETFPYLHKKYNEQYVLFITQFEINTNNKNSIEWLKQEYVREYTIHYNLFDYTGMLIRAEVITIKAGNDNKLEDIKSKYLIVLAQKLRDIILAANPS